MKVLFTGSSSFTGYWFVNYLLNQGHSVFSTFTKKKLEDYNELKWTRVQKLLNKVHPEFDTKFGDEKFLDLINTGDFDLICHHGAEVTDYKSLDFDILSAFKNNTNNIII